MAIERPLAVVDIDGVVADVRHRLHFIQRKPKDWNAFFAAADADPPHLEGLELVRQLAEAHEIVFLTGRPRRTERSTVQWLAQHGLGGHRVLMRPDSDRRPAAVLKRERLDELAAGRSVGVVVDDDPIVIRALAAAGYPTLEADWERRALEEERSLRAAQEQEGRT